MSIKDIKIISNAWRKLGIYPSKDNMPSGFNFLNSEMICDCTADTMDQLEYDVIISNKLIVNHNILEKHFINCILKFKDYIINNDNIVLRTTYTIPREGSLIMIYVLQFSSTLCHNGRSTYRFECFLVKINFLSI